MKPTHPPDTRIFSHDGNIVGQARWGGPVHIQFDAYSPTLEEGAAFDVMLAFLLQAATDRKLAVWCISNKTPTYPYQWHMFLCPPDEHHPIIEIQESDLGGVSDKLAHLIDKEVTDDTLG